MDKELKLGKNILILSIMTLVTVFTWIGFEVYYAYTKTTVPQIIRELIKPLNPNLNQKIIEDIESKYQPSTAELETISIPIPSPTLELETGEEATPSQAATPGSSLRY